MDTCIICDCKNTIKYCDACNCPVCNSTYCLIYSDGYELCGMCAYEKMKSVQDK